MNKRLTAIVSFLVFSVFLLNNIVKAEEVTRNYDEKDFQAVSVGWGMKLKITQSDKYSIEVKADKDDFRYLKVEKSGKKLRVYIDKNNYHKEGDIYVTVTMPSLEGVSLSGGSEGIIKFENPNKDFVSELSGGSELKGNLKCQEIYLELSGGSEVTLKGSGKNMKIEGSGGSEVKMKDFSVKDVSADLSGGSEVQINMDGKINCDLSGGSEIIYWGTAILGDTDFSGGSSISQGD
jgi:hypothetical protein